MMDPRTVGEALADPATWWGIAGSMGGGVVAGWALLRGIVRSAVRAELEPLKSFVLQLHGRTSALEDTVIRTPRHNTNPGVKR